MIAVKPAPKRESTTTRSINEESAEPPFGILRLSRQERTIYYIAEKLVCCMKTPKPRRTGPEAGPGDTADEPRVAPVAAEGDTYIAMQFGEVEGHIAVT
ncbi:hypothetical protein MTP99_011349 [Tenebrio molitor]|jgi:hypothetical protein|nr:hypothetical protein MTP99_011349 [Tenebrio molitor]